MTLHEALNAIRGCTWNGRRALTLRLIDGPPPADGPVFALDEVPATSEELVERYRSWQEREEFLPATISIGTTTILAGRSADSFGTAVARAQWNAPFDPIARIASGRATVVRDAVALVTGAAQGFGLEIARGLAHAGAQVVFADLNAEGARRRAVELNEATGRACASSVAVDVTDEDSVAAMFTRATELYGGLDLVVSNAGVLKAGGVKDFRREDFDFVTRVNYTGFFLVTKHAASLLARQNAASTAHSGESYPSDIIEINSKSGLVGSNRNAAYAGSKFGGIGLVQSFALELVSDAIKVNAICPGNFFDGPLWSDPERGLFVQYLRAGKVPGAQTIADVRRTYEEKVPMGRGATGVDVVRAILYVVEQAYETGQAVPVTGGQEMLR